MSLIPHRRRSLRSGPCVARPSLTHVVVEVVELEIFWSRNSLSSAQSVVRSRYFFSFPSATFISSCRSLCLYIDPESHSPIVLVQLQFPIPCRGACAITYLVSVSLLPQYHLAIGYSHGSSNHLPPAVITSQSTLRLQQLNC